MIGDRLRVGVAVVCIAGCAFLLGVALAVTDGIEEW